MGLLDGLIGAYVGLHGQSKAAQAQTQLDQAQQAQISGEQNLGNYYNQQASTDYLNTSAAKSGLAKIRDEMKSALAQGQSNMAAGGATDESKVALKTGLNKNYNQAVSNLVGYGTQYQNAMKQAYGGTLGTLYAMNRGLYEPRVQSYTNLAQSGWNAAEKGFADAAGNIPKDAKSAASLAAFLV